MLLLLLLLSSSSSSSSLLLLLIVSILSLIYNVNSYENDNSSSIINNNIKISRDLFVYQPYLEQEKWVFLYSMSEDATLISNNEKYPDMDNNDLMLSNIIYYPLNLVPTSIDTFELDIDTLSGLTFVTGKYFIYL